MGHSAISRRAGSLYLLYALARGFKTYAGPAPAARAHPCAPRHSHIPVHRGRVTFLSPQTSNQRRPSYRSPRKNRAVPCAPRPTGAPLLALPFVRQCSDRGLCRYLCPEGERGRKYYALLASRTSNKAPVSIHTLTTTAKNARGSISIRRWIRGYRPGPCGYSFFQSRCSETVASASPIP